MGLLTTLYRAGATGGGGGPVDPATLFANGEVGDWWEIGDLSTMSTVPPPTTPSPPTAHGDRIQAWFGKLNATPLVQGALGLSPWLDLYAGGLRFNLGRYLARSATIPLPDAAKDYTAVIGLKMLDAPGGDTQYAFSPRTSGAPDGGAIFGSGSFAPSFRLSPANGRIDGTAAVEVAARTGLCVLACVLDSDGVTNPKLYLNDSATDQFSGIGNGALSGFAASHNDILMGVSSDQAPLIMKFALYIDRKLTQQEAAGLYAYIVGLGNEQAIGTPAIWNACDNGGYTITGSGRVLTKDGTSWTLSRAAVGWVSGKHYWEVDTTGCTSNTLLGVSTAGAAFGSGSYLGLSQLGYGYHANGNLFTNGGSSAFGASYTAGDRIGFALNMDASTPTLELLKNNVSQGTATLTTLLHTGATKRRVFPAASLYNGTAYVTGAFAPAHLAYAPPSGFTAGALVNG